MNRYALGKHKKLYGFSFFLVFCTLLVVCGMVVYQSLSPGLIFLGMILPFLFLALYKMRLYRSFLNPKSGQRELTIPTDHTRYPSIYNSNNKRCYYTAKYFNRLTNKESRYICEEHPLESGLCIYHDDKYWKGHLEQVNLSFYDMVSRYIKENKPLIFIGFRCPLRLTPPLFSEYSQIGHKHTGILFCRPLVFLDCVFELVSFSEGEFDFVDFSHSTFNSAYFEDAKFCKLARFSGCNFQLARFTGAVFYEDVVFSTARYKFGADFDFCRFEGNADFYECKFEAMGGFYHTKFIKNVDFTGSQIHADSQSYTLGIPEMLDNVTCCGEIKTNDISLLRNKS